MIEIVKVQVGNRTKECYQYRLYAFRSPKGTYTLVGTRDKSLDSFKCIETGEYHEWSRADIKTWLDNRLIEPVKEATTLCWKI